MNSASGGPHGRNRYTQAWIDSSSSYPESSDEQLAYERDEEGLAARLYRQCRNALRDLCSQEQSGRGNMEQSYLLKEELAMLYLWGQNLGPGELDAALEYSDDVLYAVLDALGNIGHALLKGKTLKTQYGCLATGEVFLSNTAKAYLRRIIAPLFFGAEVIPDRPASSRTQVPC